jgi:hypothetical protein
MEGISTLQLDILNLMMCIILSEPLKATTPLKIRRITIF